MKWFWFFDWVAICLKVIVVITIVSVCFIFASSILEEAVLWLEKNTYSFLYYCLVQGGLALEDSLKTIAGLLATGVSCVYMARATTTPTVAGEILCFNDGSTNTLIWHQAVLWAPSNCGDNLPRSLWDVCDVKEQHYQGWALFVYFLGRGNTPKQVHKVVVFTVVYTHLFGGQLLLEEVGLWMEAGVEISTTITAWNGDIVNEMSILFHSMPPLQAEIVLRKGLSCGINHQWCLVQGIRNRRVHTFAAQLCWGWLHFEKAATIHYIWHTMYSSFVFFSKRWLDSTVEAYLERNHCLKRGSGFVNEVSCFKFYCICIADTWFASWPLIVENYCKGNVFVSLSSISGQPLVALWMKFLLYSILFWTEIYLFFSNVIPGLAAGFCIACGINLIGATVLLVAILQGDADSSFVITIFAVVFAILSFLLVSLSAFPCPLFFSALDSFVSAGEFPCLSFDSQTMRELIFLLFWFLSDRDVHQHIFLLWNWKQKEQWCLWMNNSFSFQM